MYHWKSCVLIFCFFLGCHGLSCRSEGGYKDYDVMKIYNTCMKQGNNNSSDHRQSIEWRDQEKMLNNDHETGYRDERDNRMGNRDRNRDENEDRSRMGNRDSRGDMNDRYDTENRDRGDRNDGHSNRNSKDRNMHGHGKEDQPNRSNDRLSGQDEFLHSEEYGGDNSRSYHNQYNRRNKRERRLENNSNVTPTGQRSQYNPNSHKNKSSNSSRSNSSKAQNKACALHCLMENLQMTGENGKPDRYLVAHMITKEVKNEDLRDFLQESIEECFQILDNENTEDKCEFSKNIILCLSEKGRANCDDWNDDFQL